MPPIKSEFAPILSAEQILRKGRIIDDHETPAEAVERVVGALMHNDRKLGAVDDDHDEFEQALTQAIDDRLVVFSTPVMTNAGRYPDKPITACTVPTTEVRQGNEHLLHKEITALHEQGMGTGFNLDDVDDPVAMLNILNDIAVQSAESGREDRPVGNMAVLHVSHPKIREFIGAKRDLTKNWKFNISVDASKEFMEAAASHGTYTLMNRELVDAHELMTAICDAAADCADPGLIFLDRMNDRNPVPGLGKYKTTAPCAEVGLIEGETCQFGYINFGKFVSPTSNGGYTLDADSLGGVARLLTRALDDALELSKETLHSPTSRFVLEQKRKIGIGACGIADALLIAGIPYDSEEGCSLIRDMLAIVNYHSKLESLYLGESRGACHAMKAVHVPGMNRHLDQIPHLESLYGNVETTHISTKQWQELADRIRTERTLRNITTVALPPTGRSALTIGASTGIEPHFTLENLHPEVQSVVDWRLSDPNNLDHDAEKYLATARNISPTGHVRMAATLQTICDEAISKTINMPPETTGADVLDIYQLAYNSGMSGITVYRDGTHALQPKKLEGVSA